MFWDFMFFILCVYVSCFKWFVRYYQQMKPPENKKGKKQSFKVCRTNELTKGIFTKAAVLITN